MSLKSLPMLSKSKKERSITGAPVGKVKASHFAMVHTKEASSHQSSFKLRNLKPFIFVVVRTLTMAFYVMALTAHSKY